MNDTDRARIVVETFFHTPKRSKVQLYEIVLRQLRAQRHDILGLTEDLSPTTSLESETETEEAA